MKKTLLSIALLGSAFYASSQTMVFSDNFNGLALGNLGTDLTGATLGKGGWGTYTGASGDNAATKIVNVGQDDNALQITGLGGPSASGTSRFVYHDLATGWATKTVTQDVVQLDFNFTTGPATSSLNSFNAGIYDNQGNRLAGINFNGNTKKIIGLAYYEFTNTNPSTFGLASFELGWDNTNNAPLPLVLGNDELVHISVLYSTTTGKLRFVVYHGTNMGTLDYAGSTSTALIGKLPAELDFYVSAGTNNAASADFTIDDVEVRAQSCFNPELAEFSFDNSSYCIGASGVGAIQLDPAVTGVYTSTSGLTLDASTGAVTTSTSTAGTYVVTFTSNAASDASVPNSAGCAEVHSETIIIKNCAGIEELETSLFSVYPNPVNDFVTVSVSDVMNNGTIRLLAADGKLIETREFTNSSSEKFNVQGLNSGIYFFQVGSVTEKVIIK